MNRTKTFGALTVLATPALLLAGCQDNKTATPATDAVDMNSAMGSNALSPDNAANATAPIASASVDAKTYLAKAGAGDLFEIESSKALLATSKDAKVRDFAKMMVKAHQESTAKVKAAAAEAKLTVAPPSLAPDQQAMLDEIKAAPADTIDGVYIKDQKTAHDAALALHQGYASAGDTPALKKAAGEIVPVVQEHIAHLAALPAK
jgi:putative membrane protein